MLKWAFSDPNRLKPGETRDALTLRVAGYFAGLAKTLRELGHDPRAVATFVNRLVFCMFADDVGLLPNRMFRRLLDETTGRAPLFAELASELFQAMATGGRVGLDEVAWFNGRLFDDNAVIPLQISAIVTIRKAAALDWSEIDPSIFGTLFERGLDPGRRASLGAHYTDRNKINLIIDPVIKRPLETAWKAERKTLKATLRRAVSAKSQSARTRAFNTAHRRYRNFLRRLREFKVLDPACGSGNFLYLALHALKDLELRIQVEGEALGFPRTFPEIGPANVLGIEINPFAAELARVSVWIGEIQWMRQNGFSEARNPILEPLDTIQCRDAVLASPNQEADWPQVDVIVGNPPFLGGKSMRDVLGVDYTSRLRRVYADGMPAFSDLVCYWFHKARKAVVEGTTLRVGLVATNSIRGGKNRSVLDKIVADCKIFDAWPDEPWIVEGAAVRVSLVCFSRADARLPVRSRAKPVGTIVSDLTANGPDLTTAAKLSSNRSVGFVGDQKSGPFDVAGDLARSWLSLPANPHGRPNSDVLRPWSNGRDVTGRSFGKWVIDFGMSMTRAEAALYEAPFEYVLRHVLPMRRTSRVARSREYWWRHWCPRPRMREALDGLNRFIATPIVSKHRLFTWIDSRICPDHQLFVIAREDDTTFGVLHSRFHQLWSLRLCTWQGKGNDPRYTPTTTFATFPFPEGLSPDHPASDYALNPRAKEIARGAQRLVALRNRWLHPPEWVEWIDEPAPGYPKRPVARSPEFETMLSDRTLTKLYNTRPRWLVDAHGELDAAVAKAYGWTPEISDTDALAALLQLNLMRTA